MIDRSYFSAKLGRRTAWYSECERYRYSLEICWSGKPAVMFIGLNPSTATERQDDRTIAKCIRLTKQWGGGTLVMANLFAFRSTDPGGMKASGEPVGPENTADFLVRLARDAKYTVACWGTHGFHQGRHAEVMSAFDAAGIPLYYLRINNDCSPGHPLYIPESGLLPQMWRTISEAT